MAIIFYYILKQYIRIFLLTSLTLLSIFIVVSLFEQLSRILHYNADVESVIKFLLMKVPQALYFMAPVSVLISTILCVNMLSKTNEIIAMMTCGIGLSRIILPLIFVSILITGLTFLNGELLLPYANQEKERIINEEFRKREPKGVDKRDKLWYRADGGTIWNIGLLSDNGKSIRNVTIFKYNSTGGISLRIDAPQVEFLDGKWTFFNCWMRTFDELGSFSAEFFKEKKFTFSENPNDFVTIKKDPSEMNYKEIGEYIERVKKEGLDSTKYEVDMAGKLSFPFICIIMTLIGVPFSLKTDRQGGGAMSIGIGVVLSFFIWFMFSIGITLGHSGKIPIFLSAWGSNCIWVFLSIYLIFRDQ